MKQKIKKLNKNFKNTNMPNAISFTPIASDTVAAGGRTTLPVIELPRNFVPKPEERYISFVLELNNRAGSAELSSLEDEINRKLCTKLSGYFPELLNYKPNIFDLHKKWVKTRKQKEPMFFGKDKLSKTLLSIRKKRYPKLPFTLSRLFPGSENDYKSAKRFGLHKFIQLTLPIFERQFERRTSKPRFEAALFEAAYILKEIRTVTSVNPSSEYRRFQLFSGSPGSGNNTLPKNWMLSNMKAINIPAGINGSGVVIAHPDTGWTPHSELNFTNNQASPVSPSYDLTKDWNVFNNEDTAEEPLDSTMPFHFHGTSTASIIVSRGNPNDPAALTGIAPGAKIISIRTIHEQPVDQTGVALILDTDVARAIWYASTQNADVISLSVGGYPNPVLECVVAHAVYNNTIVVAAAGQYWPFLVYPAGYPECIAVGASNDQNKPWADCVKDKKIAISAPGEKVWSAYWDDSSPNRREIIDGKGNGCSFSTALTAGAASLWLQRYGKQNLVNGLNGRAVLQELFLKHIQNTATVPPGWNTNESGAGILNVERLLDTTTLPSLSTFTGQDWNNWQRMTNNEIFYKMFEDSDPVVLRKRLKDFLNTGEPDDIIDEFGQEMLNLFMGIEDAFEDMKESAEKAGREAQDLVEDTVDNVNDFVSDTLGTIAGWFS
jgi:thermitase